MAILRRHFKPATTTDGVTAALSVPDFLVIVTFPRSKNRTGQKSR
jgi:hypothetical protein